MNIANHKKTILLIIATLIIFFAYWYFFVSKKDTSTNEGVGLSGLSTGAPSVSGTKYDKDFVASLITLNSVNLDTSIFESNTYKVLNFPETPFPENFFRESGRTNPFLPIGIDESGVNNNTSVQNQLNIGNIPVAVSTSTTITNNIKNSTSSASTTETIKPIRKNF